MTSLGLKRVPGLPTITFIAMGFTISGGVFVFTGIVYTIAGQTPLYALSCARYTRVFFPELSPNIFATALLTFTCFGANGNIEHKVEIVSPGRVISRA